jgi:hypothetical protein
VGAFHLIILNFLPICSASPRLASIFFFLFCLTVSLFPRRIAFFTFFFFQLLSDTCFRIQKQASNKNTDNTSPAFFFLFVYTAAFGGAYDRSRVILQSTRLGPLTDERRICAAAAAAAPSAIHRVGDDSDYDARSVVRWAEERARRAASVRDLDGRVSVSPTRRVPVSDGVVAFRSWHVDIWLVWLVIGCFGSGFSLPSRCVYNHIQLPASRACSHPQLLATPARPR